MAYLEREGKTVPESQVPFLEEDRNVHRYFVARKGNVADAAEMLGKSLIFRDEKGLCGEGALLAPKFIANQRHFLTGCSL